MLDKTLKQLLEAALRTPEGAAMAYDVLTHVVLPWRTDGSMPPKLQRHDGHGAVVAVVDRWCGGYQDAHKPVVVGWQACLPSGGGGTASCSGMVLVTDPDDIQALSSALAEAQDLAEAALATLCVKYGYELL